MAFSVRNAGEVPAAWHPTCSCSGHPTTIQTQRIGCLEQNIALADFIPSSSLQGKKKRKIPDGAAGDGAGQSKEEAEDESSEEEPEQLGLD